MYTTLMIEAMVRGLELRWVLFDSGPGGYMTVGDPSDELFYEIYPVLSRDRRIVAWEVSEGGQVLLRRPSEAHLLDVFLGIEDAPWRPTRMCPVGLGACVRGG